MTPHTKTKGTHAEPEDQQETRSAPVAPVSDNGDPRDYTEVQEGFINFDDSLRAFLKLIRTIRQYFLSAFFIGLGLAVSGELLVELLPKESAISWETIWIFIGRFICLLIKDAGIALSVSAIAVFGYERIKHARGEFERAKRLEGALMSIDKARKKLQDAESLQACVTALSAQIERQGQDLQVALASNLDLTHKLATIHTNLVVLSEGNTYDQCRSALDLIFSAAPGGKQFSHSLQELLIAARALKNSHRERPDLQPYLGFLAWLIEQVPNRYAKALSHFATGDDGTYPVRDIPSATSMASQLLFSYMSLMNQGDEYLAVSNILFWDAGQWSSFQAAVKAACTERGVKSRRIVNLCSYMARREKLQLTDDEIKQVRERIATHLALQAAAPDNYHVRFFGPNEVQKVARNVDETHRFATTAFGIFLYDYEGVSKGKIIRAQDESVSTIIFDHNLGLYHGMFERMWQEASLESPLDV